MEQEFLIDVQPEKVEPPVKPPPKTWWKIEDSIASVREVTEANKRYYERWNYLGSQFFETKEEAVAVKIKQLEDRVSREKDNLRKAEARLKNFKKKCQAEK